MTGMYTIDGEKITVKPIYGIYIQNGKVWRAN